MENIENNSKDMIFNAFSMISSQEYEAALEVINQINIDEQSIEIKAKLYAWKAQCLLNERRPHQAIQNFNFAIRLAKSQGHMDAVVALREQRDIATAQATALDAVQSSPHTNPVSQALSFSQTQPEVAISMLQTHLEAMTNETPPKDKILCILAIARLDSNPNTHLEHALSIAQQENDPNLITAVKRTMDHLGFKIKPHTF